MRRALLVIAVSVIALCVLASIVYYEGIRLLEESGRVGRVEERVVYWARSAGYMLLFAVLALLVVLLISIAVYLHLTSREH